MDINETLRVLRDACSRNRDKEFMSDDDATTMVEGFDALDEWLSKGGFLPVDWRSATVGIGTRDV
jgi:hypothetical protein